MNPRVKVSVSTTVPVEVIEIKRGRARLRVNGFDHWVKAGDTLDASYSCDVSRPVGGRGSI